MKKHLLFIFTALLPLLASAQQVTVNGVIYGNSSVYNRGLQEGEAAVIDYTNDLPTAMVIEDEVEIGGVAHRVVAITDRLFSNNSTHKGNIISVKLPADLKSIGSYAFENCSNLETVTGVPSSNLESMGNRVFNGTKWIKGLEGEGVYLFGGWAIAYIGTVPNELVMPEATVGICESFLKHGPSSGYSNLKTLVLNEGLKTIQSGAFDNCYKLAVINVPASVEYLDADAFKGCCITAYNVAEGNAMYSSADGVLFNADKTILRVYPSYKTGDSYTTPAGLTTVGTYAFYGASLKNLVISEGVTSIGSQAIRQLSSLETLDLPSTLESLGTGTFYNCKKLTTVILRSTTIPSYNGDDLSSSSYNNTVLYVPAESVDAYIADANWGKLNNSGARDNIKSMDAIVVSGVTLDQTTATLTEGETLTLTATVAPATALNKTVVWSTSDAEVATVDKNGVVTAVAEGTATITAKAGDKEATCVVTVEKKVIAVSGIALDQTAATLTEGETLTLTATVSPDDATDKTVTWETSDAAIATVENGVVTAVAPGTVTITAKAGDKTAICTITVDKKVIVVSGIALDQTAATLTEGETLTLTATVSPDDATDKTVVWSTSNAEVATVDENGIVTAVAEGTATITATASGKEATCVVTVEKKQAEEDPTGIEQVEAQGSTVIYDLMGRRVEKAEKGIYIVGGKKVVLK